MANKLKLLSLLPLMVASAASALPITKIVTIQPILLAWDTVATVPYASYESALDKIWAQAGIDIAFLAPNTNPQSNSDSSVTLSELSPPTVGSAWGPMPATNTSPAFFIEPRGQSPDPLVINMWFVDEIRCDLCGGGTLLGVAHGTYASDYSWNYDHNGVVISNAIFDDYSPDLFDVMAHELGHNLGLAHIDLPTGWESPPSCTGASYSQINNLMTSCLQTQFTRSLENISPDGQDAFHLTDAQVSLVRGSVFAQDLVLETPEPATLALVLLGLAASGMARRGSQKS